MADDPVFSFLRDHFLFAEVKPEDLRRLLAQCNTQSYQVGEIIYAARGQLPILLITRGCVAVQISTRNKQHLDLITALLMPKQLAGEFEFLNVKRHLKLIAVQETEVINIPRTALSDLARRYANLMQSLALSLVEKSEINNFHFEVVSHSKGDMKIATMLSGFYSIQPWKQEQYIDESLRTSLEPSIAWSIGLLRKYLACDKRTIRDGLLKLYDDGLVDIVFIDEKMAPTQNIDIFDLRRFGTNRDRKVQEKTLFKIRIISPQTLDDYCEGPD